MAEFRLSPAARSDLADIWHYTRQEWGREQANRYLVAIEMACARLADVPMLAQDCRHIRPGYRRRGVGQHMIYLQVTDYGVAIVRILHQHMDASRRF